MKLFKKELKTSHIITGVFIVAALIYAAISSIYWRAEYIQYKEIGENFVSVFWVNLKTIAIISVISFITIFAAIYITNLFIRKGLKTLCHRENVDFVKMPNKSLAIIVALFGSIYFAQNLFSSALSFINSTWFNTLDPLFGKNIGYFVFQRPFLMLLTDSISSLMIGIVLYTLAYYIVGISMLMSEGVDKKVFKESAFVTHNITNLLILLFVRAYGFYLNVEGLVFSEFLRSTVDNIQVSLVGAGFIDANITRYIMLALPYITILCIIFALLFLRRKNIKKTFMALAVIPVVLITQGVVTIIADIFIVSPNELELERKFMEYNMKYTKQGYNLNIEKQTYDVSEQLTQENLDANKETVNNIRIVDYAATLKVLNQYQTIKGYYRFKDSDIAVYDVDGKPTALFISAREIDQELLKDKNYINRRFQYTHGYGIVVNSVNSIDENGYPTFIVKDLTSNISNKGINITQPRIYFGELTNEHVVVNASNIKEFDYPDGDTEVEEYEYSGDAGIKMTLGNRILMALKNSDPKLIYSQYINNDSKLLVNRNVIDRVEKVAPFLEYDTDPYMVITEEGRLVWIIDAYTITSNYPYSQNSVLEKMYPTGIPYKVKYNYIRNSVKVLVDAYDGTTKFYIIDRDDPLVMSYNKMYPGLFESIDTDINNDVWDHMRYPEFLFKIQSDILKKYHVDNVDIFYRNEDLWSDATHNVGTREETIAPYYTITQVNGKQEFVLISQYTPYNRKNLIAWNAVYSDKENYGKFVLYTFPKDSNILGPMQLDNQIDQNPDISKDLSLWNSGGSSVLRNMTIVPVGNTLVYVESIYLAAMNESQIPAIKKIVVAYGNKLAIADNLQDALNKIINKQSIDITVENTDTLNGILETIIATNKNLQESASTGNWEMYGKDLQKLNDLIKQLEKVQQEQAEAKVSEATLMEMEVVE